MLLRRLRGLVLTGIIWGVLWSLAGAMAGLYSWYRAPIYDLLTAAGAEKSAALPIILSAMLGYGIWGILIGIIFAFVLMTAERRHRLHELSATRFAIWGAASAILLPLGSYGLFAISYHGATIPLQTIVALILMAGMGAVCASGMLALARRTENKAVQSPAA